MDYSLISRLKSLFPWLGEGVLIFSPDEKPYNVEFWSSCSSSGPSTYRAYYERKNHHDS